MVDEEQEIYVKDIMSTKFGDSDDGGSSGSEEDDEHDKSGSSEQIRKMSKQKVHARKPQQMMKDEMISREKLQ